MTPLTGEDHKNKKFISTSLNEIIRTLVKNNPKEMQFVIAQTKPLFKDLFNFLKTQKIYFPQNYKYILKVDGESIAVHRENEIIFRPLKRTKKNDPLDDLSRALKEFHIDNEPVSDLDEEPLDKYSFDPSKELEEMHKHYQALYQCYEPVSYHLDDEQETDAYSSDSMDLKEMYKHYQTDQRYEPIPYHDHNAYCSDSTNEDGARMSDCDDLVRPCQSYDDLPFSYDYRTFDQLLDDEEGDDKREVEKNFDKSNSSKPPCPLPVQARAVKGREENQLSLFVPMYRNRLKTTSTPDLKVDYLHKNEKNKPRKFF